MKGKNMDNQQYSLNCSLAQMLKGGVIMDVTTPEQAKALNLWKKGTRREQTEMGKISNLITDMTIQNAPEEELIRAVKHSMVIIDVGKHQLDYKRSAKDNRITELQKKYQPKYDEKTGKCYKRRI